ncbi:MAG: hypothetical protein PHG70_09575 [Synergistaceae bacterium]|nr:hypothetical protein [Synergistaceae bacterium]
MPNIQTETFQGYCPTQDKWEKVEQEYFDVTTKDSNHRQYLKGLMNCPYICFKNGTCPISEDCPVLKGEWTSDSPDVLIALQFNDSDGNRREIVDEVIKPVCSEMGLNAFIVLDIEHNDVVYDVILKSISKSRFIIADLTYNNNGAYYEAGYAKGQGKIVIHTCYKEWFTTSGVHFDVNALNLIIYDDNNDLAIKLRNRIRETGNIITK